jgi:hypothetical protein
MNRHDMRITSRSMPPGQAPFDVTLSIHDEAGTTRYQSKDELKMDLFKYTQTTKAGFENTLQLLEERQTIVCKAVLSEVGYKHFTGQELPEDEPSPIPSP